MINHIEIYVSSLDKSKKFYSLLLSLLGYELFQEWDRGFSFKQNNFYLVFVQVEKQYENNEYHRKNIGLNHLAFTVKSENEVNTIREKLKRVVTELYSDDYPYAGGHNHYAFFFEDPDRIKIEITNKKM